MLIPAGGRPQEAAELAPENTYMSFEKAVAAGSDGLETDVTISYDGVPFLMHDKNLRRTTNVKDVFPNWSDVSLATFTWRELKCLNAGSGFLSTPDEYRLVWALTDLTSLILVLIIFVFPWWRERGLALCVGNISALENGSFIQFRTEINEVWSLFNTSASEKQGTSLSGPW